MTDSTHDVRTLARLASDGDLTALGPLLDALKEAGDWRAQELHKLIGWLASRSRITHAVALKYHARLWRLFWPELSSVGALEMLSDLDAKYKAATVPATTVPSQDTHAPQVMEWVEAERVARERRQREVVAQGVARLREIMRDTPSAPTWELRKTPSSNQEG